MNIKDPKAPSSSFSSPPLAKKTQPFPQPAIARMYKVHAKPSSPSPDPPTTIQSSTKKPPTKNKAPVTNPPPTSPRKAPKPTKKNPPIPKASPDDDAQTHRDGYGSARATTESKLMAEHKTLLLTHKLIDVATATKLAQPWHKTGTLTLQWEQKHLNPSLQTTTPIPPLEQATRLALAKDAAERKWLQDWRAGRIDDEGERIARRASNRGSRAACAVSEDGCAGAAETKGTLSGGGAPASEKMNRVEGVSGVKVRRRGRRAPRREKPAGYVDAEGGAETYEQYGYNEIVAIGRERGLMTGGDVWTNRERLVADDRAVREGTERETVSYSRGRARGFKTEAPVVARAPTGPVEGQGKRKRGGGDEEVPAGKKKKVVE